MCILCDSLNSYSFGIAEPNDRFALYGMSIAPAELIDTESVGVTRGVTTTDGVLDYYLHKPGGAVNVSGAGFGEQNIQSFAIPGSDQDYFNAMVRRLDNIIDLDFRQVDNASSADVDLYYDTEIDLYAGKIILGLAAASGVGGWEIYLNYSALKNDEFYRRYTLIHEFGHALGLEHPFEARDGDVFKGNTDPWSSAYPEDTVMAYRRPVNESWPDFFSVNDINALIEVWGPERQYLEPDGSRFDGNIFKDDVLGGSGPDLILGSAGFDVIAGGPGDDELRGGRNGDNVRGGSGNDKIFGGRGHDSIFGGRGDDVLRGGFGADSFFLSEGNDRIEDFRLSEYDQVGIPVGLSYELRQEVDELQLISSLGTTTFLAVDQHSFLAGNPFFNI